MSEADDACDEHTAFDYIICEETSEDIEATKRCLRAMLAGEEDLYCGESGATLRFLLPVIGALGARAIFHPEGRLAERPMAPLIDELCAHGMSIHKQCSDEENPTNARRDKTSGRETIDAPVLVAEGKLASGTYRLPGNVSSQFVSGLLFALPLLGGDSEIVIDGTLESSPYVDMTVDTLGKFGILIEDETTIECTVEGIYKKRILFIRGNQAYIAPSEYIVQGDWSNAAFWFAMGAIGADPIKVEGLSAGTFQADERIWDAIDVFGIHYEFGPKCVTVYPSRGKMRGITWDASDTPDMVPVLALLGGIAEGETKIVNAARLRLKESDRLHAVAETLHALGIYVEEFPDGLVIHGKGGLLNHDRCDDGFAERGVHDETTKLDSYGDHKSTTLDSYGDHRIAMMIAAASVAMGAELPGEDEGMREDDSRPQRNKIRLSGWQAVNKSYPSFFEAMAELGLDGHIELV